MSRPFDATDARMLACLRHDARERLSSIAERLKIPTSTAHDRIVRLKRQGIRFSALIDWSLLGYSLTVCFIVPYSETIINNPAVNTCVRVSPNALIVECVFASMLELEEFHQIFPHAKIYPVVETLKKEGFIPDVAKM